MKIFSDEIWNSTTNGEGSSFDIRQSIQWSMLSNWAFVAIGSAQTVNNGAEKVSTITCPAFAGSTGGDYISVPDTSGNTWAVGLRKAVNVNEINTVTMVDKATCVARDFLYFHVNGSSNKYAVWLRTVADVKDKNRVTFPALLGATDGDFVLLTAADASKWAIALDTDGSGVANAGVKWSAATQIVVDVSACTDATSVAAAVYSAMTVGILAKFTITDNLNGTIDFEAKTAGTCAAAEVLDAAETGAGSITFSHTATGTSATVAPSGTLYTAATGKAMADVSGATTAASVATIVRGVVNTLCSSVLTIGTTSGADFTVTQLTPGPASNINIYSGAEGAGSSASIVETLPGVTETPEPTGALWVAATAARRTMADISGATTSTDVALIVRAALVGLTNITSLFTIASASGANIQITSILRGVLATPTPKNADDSGAGSITAAQNTAGVDSAINVSTNIITKTSHGAVTGQKVAATTTGTLPAPLTTTDYYIIKVTNDTFKLATTRDFAVAGTAIDLTDQGGSGNTSTFTPAANAGTLNIEYCPTLSEPKSTDTWYTHTSINLASASSPSLTTIVDNTHMYVRIKLAITSGALSACTSQIFGKGM